MQYAVSSDNYSTSVRGTPSKWNGKDDKGYAYKKSTYQYSSSGNENASYVDNKVDKNIDQLDALLEDLKNERQITREKDLLSPSVNYRIIERDVTDPIGTITKTTKVVKTSKQLGPNRIIDDNENFSTSDYNYTKSTLHGTTQPSDDYQLRENIYATNKTVSGNIYDSRNKIYESNRILENSQIVPTSTKTTTTTSNLGKELQDIPLTDDIMPVPGTKVTTTVRTYTYEIPANTPPNIITNRQQNLKYDTIQHNEIRDGYQLQPHQPSHIPPTVVYNTESYSTVNKTNERPIVSNQSYEIREHRETNTIQNGLPPQLRSPPSGPIGGTSKTMVYSVNTTENTRTGPEPHSFPRSPSHSPNVPTGNQPYGLPVTNRYFYKESTNTTNTIHGPNVPNEPNYTHSNVIMPPPHKHLPSGYPPNDNEYPPGPTNSSVTYKYTTSTSNSRRGPDYGTPSPNMPPAPFPIDDINLTAANTNPPQRVDDLMQSFDNADGVDRSDVHTHRKREIDTSVASSNQPNIPTVNRAGKEVYYPPGHEMMLMKREEMAAGSAAGGRWAKGSGMYEYESGYKSKTTSKSGGTMVPVCLPLCCAMPCSIM